jgi:hypothetical protein
MRYRLLRSTGYGLGHIRAEIHSITTRLMGVDRSAFVSNYLLRRAGETIFAPMQPLRKEEWRI